MSKKLTNKEKEIELNRMEVEIDNVLSHLNIEHEKNIKYPFDESFNPNNRKTCDWKVNDMYIEYCGLMNYYDKKIKDRYCDKIDDKLHFLMNKKINCTFLMPPISFKEIREFFKEEFNRGD